MTVWKNSTAEDGEFAGNSYDVQVRITDDDIVVTFDYDDGDVEEYRGTQVAPGHFELRSKDGISRASLHRFPEGRVMVGYYQGTPGGDSSDQGFWRIKLQE